MNGSFNGIQLRRITSVATVDAAPGFKRTKIRIASLRMPQLEQILQLGAQATLILSDEEIDGRIVQYAADIHSGYEVTIESRKVGPVAS